NDKMKPVLIVGGSGVVGSHMVRALRRLQPTLPIVIGVRDVARAQLLADEIGHARALAVDLERDDLGLPSQPWAAVVVFLRDESLRTLRFAQEHSLPYIAFSDFSFEIAPVVAMHVARPTSAPILMLGQLFGGAVSLATLQFARELARVDEIAIGAILDEADSGGPAAQGDAARVASTVPNPLVRRAGRFLFAQGPDQERDIVSADGERFTGHAYPLLDVASLAAASGASSVRVDLALRPRGARTGPETEVVVELTGHDHAGTPASLRFGMRDGDFHGRLSGHAAALALEALLGARGRAPTPPGLYNPEQLLDPSHVIARLRVLGTTIERL
ncbi:MAG TPA: hypothetical protein VMF89_33175, partial [Polyangiales bacterium]|nr:hypothetical protein [Polyangiales bacterium]